jgi:hypothetical protein
MGIRDGQLLYHLTELKNMENILKYGLLSRNRLFEEELKFEDVANPEILSFRSIHGLDNYVPFHFFSNNPFDGDVQKSHPEDDFVYLCVKRTVAREMGFEIIPRHPLNMAPFRIYTYDGGMTEIDWDTMEQRCYSDHECKEVCLAECIYDGDLSIYDFINVTVRTEKDKGVVESLFDKYSIRKPPYINLSPNYFIAKK